MWLGSGAMWLWGDCLLPFPLLCPTRKLPEPLLAPWQEIPAPGQACPGPPAPTELTGSVLSSLYRLCVKCNPQNAFVVTLPRQR
jgi:hypothetical protein